MKFALGTIGPDTATDLLAVLLTEESLGQDALVDALDKALDGLLRTAIADEEFTAKKDSALSVATYGRATPRKVLLLGLGAAAKVGANEVRAAAAKAARTANAEKATSLALSLPDGEAETIRAGVIGASLGAYRFTKYLTGDRRPKKSIERVTLSAHAAKGAKATAEQKRALAQGEAVAKAINLSRDLVNDPPNELTPAALADVAARVAQEGGLSVKILDRAKIRAAGMKLLDAVGRGSRNEPRFIHMTWKPEKTRKGRKRVVLVGKGLCFDSGGLCIKPAQGMGDMKSDMGGAALAVGAMAAVAALQPDVEVHALIAAAENMPDGDAYRPGDVFGSLDGKTVEIINTDAEGRLVLADALTYASRLEPDLIVDAATLTGACIVALGKTCSAYYTSDAKVAKAMEKAAAAAGEQFWHMPLLEDLRSQLDSDCADLKHLGDRWGGSITAALFLREFTGGKRWMHCDIAGPVLADRAKGLYPKGATGHPVLTFTRLVESYG